MKFIVIITAGAALVGSLAVAKEATAAIKVKEMACGSCAAAVKKALTSTKGVRDADVSLEKGTATVVYEDSQVTEKQLANVIKKARSEAQHSKSDRKEKPMQTLATSPSVSGLEPLFTAVLQYRSDSPDSSVIPNQEREGAFIGSGDGAAIGERLRGKVRWSLWSGSCVYPLVRNGQTIPEGMHLCTMNPTGFIETPDGARIRFDGRGYGLRSPDKYRTSLTLVFGTEDARYAWLIKELGVMEGEFDEKAGRAIWNVYVPAGK